MNNTWVVPLTEEERRKWHRILTSDKKKSAKSLLTPDQKALLWKQQDNIARRWEPRFAEAAVQAFEDDRRAILALVTEARETSKARKATLNYGELLDKILAYIAGDSQENWRKVFLPVIEGLIIQQGEMWNAAMGMQWDVRNLFAEAAFNDYMIKFAQQIAKTTNDDITALLQQAMKEGWSIPDMEKALGSLFEQYMSGDLTDEQRAWFEERMPAYRRENISRTETIRASNNGSYQLFKGWGAQGKEWLATYDPPRARDTHMAAGTRYSGAGAIPIGDPFMVDGEALQYPGDPNGSAANVCNCRCSLSPVLVLPGAQP